jgi:alpha-D-ribose 1-methylphosphonate 5-triphosphate synthase subunit PhnI
MYEDQGCVIIEDGLCRVTMYPPAGFTAHWLEHQVDIIAGAFRGTIVAAAYANPYPQFHRRLSELYKSLSGSVRLGPSYENFDMDFRGDGKGHIAIAVAVVADHSRPIKLNFGLVIDQTQLRQILDQIDRVFVQGS